MTPFSLLPHCWANIRNRRQEWWEGNYSAANQIHASRPTGCPVLCPRGSPCRERWAKPIQSLFHPREAPNSPPLDHVSLTAALSAEDRNRGGKNVSPQSNEKTEALRHTGTLESTMLSRNMLQAPENRLIAKNLKGLGKRKRNRNERLLCIYYAQGAGLGNLHGTRPWSLAMAL